MTETKHLRFRTVTFALIIVLSVVSAYADPISLPQRSGERPKTTAGVPHVQLNVESKPELAADVLQQVAGMPGVEIRPTVLSLRGAQGFNVSEDVRVTRPEVIVGGREFAHLHPDGSLHATLPPELASEAVEKGWAVFHPWAKQRSGWEGFVMIYTPQNPAERDIVLSLVEQSYRFVTGTSGS